MTDSEKPTSKRRRPNGLLILFGVLIVWTIVISIGTIQTQASTDLRRPLIVIGTMGTFLGGWAWALKLRQSRLSS